MTRTIRTSAAYPKTDPGRRKRLGQYFTGERLARLLVAIADGSRCRTVLDPMCGSGDMLAEVSRAAPRAQLVGIEIDLAAYELCSSRFSDEANKPHLIHGNAFNWSNISRLPNNCFDLTITNPPYVRYQSFAGNRQMEVGDLPDAESVRQGLLEVAQNLSGLEDEDRNIFISLIKGYSGLSDLAVPSWILCAMLTAVGGRLAMVVPESWLNRDYAYPIHYLLLKLFRVLWVVEDSNRAWFENAQIKTTLLVAERIPRVDDLQTACAGQTYVHIALLASAITERSVVGAIYPTASNPEAAFAEELSRFRPDASTAAPGGSSVTLRSLEGKLADLLAASRESGWLQRCEPNLAGSSSKWANRSAKIPQTLLDLLPQSDATLFTTIEALGGRVGQGLRTGANEFFYCDLVSETEGECLVSPGKSLKLSPLLLPKAALRPVLRKQSELPNGYVIVPSSLKGRVLALDQFIHPEDENTVNGEGSNVPGQKPSRTVMPPALASLVTTAARTNVGTEDRPKLIPEMSAVRTNETKSKDSNTKARYWYMLPPLARRHLPDLLAPRINHLHPKVILNSDERTIIDANFSTIWLEEGARVDAYGLLACLNSSWAVAAMELTAAVMGGGALKLEAAHLRHLPIPALPAEQWSELSTLGRQLASGTDTEKILSTVNLIIAKALFGEERASSALEKLERIKEVRLDARKTK